MSLQKNSTLERPTGFEQAALPFALDAMEPFMSAQTLSYHYGKHHKTYVETLNKLISGTEWEGAPLEDIIIECAGLEDKRAIFNNAAQTWNHAFFWQCLKVDGGGFPRGSIKTRLEESFGSYNEFKNTFIAAALAQFGSGWAWLVQNGDGLKVIKTPNADNPMTHGQVALMTCDVWEHAYYLDYQNRRKDYVETFLDHLVNWDFAESQLL